MEKEPAQFAEFIEDISFHGMIHALIIRSPRERGKIKDIKHPKLPNSYYLITAQVIPGENHLAGFSIPVLAETNLSYIGEPVAILAGPDISKLEEFAASIEIIADEEAPALPADIIISRDIITGNPDKILEDSKNIVSGTYTTGIQEHWYAESHGAVAVYSAEGLTVYTATQWPYHVKRSLALVLGYNDEKVTVNPTRIAQHLDGKIWYPSLVACHAALAAQVTGKPVMLMLTREEDFLFSPKRNRSDIEIHSALGEEGEILASSIDIKLDLGAEGVFEDEIIDHSCLGSLGVYRHNSYRITGSGIRSNIPPQGPMAGFGLSQGFFAIERHVSRIADSLGQDPAEWRKNNFLTSNQSLGIGTVLKENVPLPELIDAVTAMSDYHRKWASYEHLRQRRKGQKAMTSGEPLRGIGISTGFQGTGFLHHNKSGNGNCEVELSLDKDGFLDIKTSLIASGMGYFDHWRGMVQEILGITPEMIRLSSSTKEAPDSGTGTLSRNIGQVTSLVELCCNTIREQRFRESLPITVRRSAKDSKAPGWTEGTLLARDVFSNPGFAAAVIEIEIDPVSLSPLIRGIWLAADAGKILSLRQAHRTMRTGIIQALGWTSREKLYYSNGKINQELYHSYNIASTSEIPPITVDFIRNNNTVPKGIGDLPFCCVPPAYVQAVSQAMDHHFEKIPLDTCDIWEAGKQNLPESAL